MHYRNRSTVRVAASTQACVHAATESVRSRHGFSLLAPFAILRRGGTVKCYCQLISYKRSFRAGATGTYHTMASKALADTLTHISCSPRSMSGYLCPWPSYVIPYVEFPATTSRKCCAMIESIAPSQPSSLYVLVPTRGR